ncbi:MAG: hypothetical protein ACKVGW_17945 [Verrucomicrobiia bacterium]
MTGIEESLDELIGNGSADDDFDTSNVGGNIDDHYSHGLRLAETENGKGVGFNGGRLVSVSMRLGPISEKLTIF